MRGIASALNKIIHNSPFQKEDQSGGTKRDRFLRGRQIAYLIYDQFRVTGTDDSVENYTEPVSLLLFEMTIFRNSILSVKEFCCLWRKIPHDDILEGIVHIKNTRVWKIKDCIGIVRPGGTHQKKLGPDYHRLNTTVKRSIEQEIRKNFGGQKWQFWEERRGQESGKQNSVYKEFLEIDGNGKPTGSGVKGDNCSFRPRYH